MSTPKISKTERLLRRAANWFQRNPGQVVYHPDLCKALRVKRDGKADRAFYNAMRADRKRFEHVKNEDGVKAGSFRAA